MSKSKEIHSEHKSQENENKCVCGFIVAPIVLLSLLTPFILLLILEIQKSSLLETNCTISLIEYPKSINDNNFVECDCGRHCISDKGICIQVYVTNLIDNVTVFLQSGLSLDNTLDNCTFKETHCLSGEQFSDRIETINNIPIDYSEYFNTWENNETMKCFLDATTKDVYLTADSVLGIILALGILFIIVLLSCFLLGCCDACYHKHS